MSPLPSPLSPTWSLDSLFPAFDGEAHHTFVADLRRDLTTRLASIRSLGDLAATNVAAWTDAFVTAEDLNVRLTHLGAFYVCLGAADAANESYQAAEAALDALLAEFTKIVTELRRGLRNAGGTAWQQLLAEPRLAHAAYALGRLREEGRFQMDMAGEALAADLGVDGISAWGRLYDTVTGKMKFSMTWPDGRVEDVPMSQRRALLTDPDPRVRAAAFTQGNKVWEASEDMMGAALNALAGTRHTLYARRGREHFLAVPLHDSAVSRETLDAMFQAIRANYAVPRRILALSARLQGTAALRWHDLDVPQLASPFPSLDWTRAVELVDRAFGGAYPRLQQYYRSMLERRWIESEKRPNKRAGAFQSSTPLICEERIFMTYGNTIGDVTTLAHEVGHAWHTHLLNDLRPCARDYPMTLAETASTFAEMILSEGLLASPGIGAEERAFLIEQSVTHAPSYLLNIPVRFEFESRFYEERKNGTVPVSRIKALMVEAQREVYGDTLAPGGEDPWFWASKLHFFIPGVSFYNFPYTFGFLLSQALFQEFRREGPAFLGRYETFLRLTGSATCEEVVQQSLGRDLRDPQFWADAIRGLMPRVDDYAAIVAARTK